MTDILIPALVATSPQSVTLCFVQCLSAASQQHWQGGETMYTPAFGKEREVSQDLPTVRRVLHRKPDGWLFPDNRQVVYLLTRADFQAIAREHQMPAP